MGEDEIIKNLNDLLEHNYLEDIYYLREENDYIVYNNSIQGLLDLYNNQKQQFTELQAINEEHRKENGELRKELKQKKEKIEAMNKGIDELVREKQDLKTELYMNSISKDKIRAKIKELEEKSDY
jgi:predicted nuclease with TOPRIM domain